MDYLRIACIGFCACLFTSLTSDGVRAANVEWFGDGDGELWSDVDNWDNNGALPGVDDTAIIDLSASDPTIRFDLIGGPTQILRLISNENFVLDSGTLQVTGATTPEEIPGEAVFNIARLTLDGGNISTVDGVKMLGIVSGPDVFQSELVLNSGAITGANVTGPGLVQLERAKLTLGNGYSEAANFEFRRSDNGIGGADALTTGNLVAGQTITIFGNEGSGNGVSGEVTLASPLAVTGTTVTLTSEDTPNVNNNVGSATLNLADTALTIKFGGVLEVDAGVGGGRAITGTESESNGQPRRSSQLILESGGHLNVKTGAALVFVGEQDATLDGDEKIELNAQSGSTIDGQIFVSDAKLKIANGVNGAATFELTGVNSTLEGNLNSTQNMTIRGSDPNVSSFGKVTLSGDAAIGGDLILTSDASDADGPGAVIDIMSHDLITTGSVDVQGTNGVRVITGNGTFESSGTVTVDPGTPKLTFEGVQDGTVAGTETIDVKFNNGSINGDFLFSGSSVTIDNQVAGTAALRMEGTNNHLQGSLNSGHSMTLAGTNPEDVGETNNPGLGISLVKLSGDVTSVGTVVLDSSATLPSAAANSNGVIPGAKLDLDTHEFVNEVGGAIQIAAGTQFRQISGTSMNVLNNGVITVTPLAKLTNRGDIVVDPGTVLEVIGTQDGVASNGDETVALDMQAGSSVNGELSLNKVALKMDAGVTGTSTMVMIGPGNTLEGTVGTGHEVILRGSLFDANPQPEPSPGVATLRADTELAGGQLTLDSTTPDAGATLNVDSHTLTNSSGTLNVKLVDMGTEPAKFTQILGAGSFVNSGGTIDVVDGATLEFAGVRPIDPNTGVPGDLDPLDVNLASGTVGGSYHMTGVDLTVGAGLNVEAGTTFEMQGTANQLSATTLNSNLTMKLVGTDGASEFGSSNLKVATDVISSAKIELGTEVAGVDSLLTIAGTTFTNANDGVIQVKDNNGRTTGVLGANGTLVHQGQIIVDSAANALTINGDDEDTEGTTESMGIELASGSAMTGPGRVEVLNSRLTIDPTATADNLVLLGTQNELTGVGTGLGAGMNMTLLGTDGIYEFGSSILEVTTNVASSGTIKMNPAAAGVDAILKIANTTFTNETGGLIQVESNSGRTTGILGANGTFIHQGTIQVDGATNALTINGDDEDTEGTTESMDIELASGSAMTGPGRVEVLNSRLTIDPTAAADNLILLGTQNELTGVGTGLGAGMNMTLLGTDGIYEFGSSILEVTTDVASSGTIKMNPAAAGVDAILKIANTTFTNEIGGSIQVELNSGRTTGILGANGTFIHQGTIQVDDAANALRINGDDEDTTGTTESMDIELASGSAMTGPGRVEVLNSRLTVDPTAAADNLILLGTQNELTGVGTGLGAGMNMTLLGTDGIYDFGSSILEVTTDVDSSGTIKMNPSVAGVDAILKIANTTFTNETGGLIQVESNSGRTTGILGANGTFIHQGTIQVDDATNALVINGDDEDTTGVGQQESMDIELASGSQMLGPGRVEVLNSRLTIDPTATADNLILLGTQNELTGVGTGLGAGMNMTLLGTDGGTDFGSSILEVTTDVDSSGTIKMNPSVAGVDAILKIASTTFTNETGGLIQVESNSGRTTGILGANGAFIHQGTIQVDDAANALMINGDDDDTTGAGQQESMDIELASGSQMTGPGRVEVLNSRLTVDPTAAADNLVLLGTQNELTGVGTGLGAGMNMTLFGTDRLNEFGSSILTVNTDVNSSATIKMNSNAAASDSLLKIANTTFTNETGGLIQVESNSGRTTGILGANGAFIHQGTIQVDDAANALMINGDDDDTTGAGQQESMDIELASGSQMTGPGRVEVLNSRLTVDPTAAADNLVLLGTQNELTGVGTGLGAGMNMTLFGTDRLNEFGSSILTVNTDVNSSATIKLNSNAAASDALLKIANTTFTNETGGLIQVELNSGRTTGILGANGTFIHQGTIQVDDATNALIINGDDEDTDGVGQQESMDIELASGSQMTGPGRVEVLNSRLTIDPTATADNLMLLGTQNELTGVGTGLGTGMNMTLLGTDRLNEFGSSILTVNTDVNSSATIKMNSNAAASDALLKIANTTFTNETGGLIQVELNSGRTTGILGANGTFIHQGTIQVDDATNALIINGDDEDTDGVGQQESMDIELASGSQMTGPGRVEVLNSRLTVDPTAAADNLVLLGTQNELTGVGTGLGTGMNMTLFGTDRLNEFGSSILTVNMDVNSSATIKLNSNAAASDALLKIANTTFTNETGGLIQVELNSGRTTGILGANGTFIHQGTIQVDDATNALIINGDDEDTDGVGQLESMNVEIANGSQMTGRVDLINTRTTIGGTAEATNLTFLGTNNQLTTASLGSGLTMRLLGTDELGSSILGVQSNLVSAGTIVFDSEAVNGVGENNVIPGGSLDIQGNGTTFTNTEQGQILVKAGTGGVRAINQSDANAQFINAGRVTIESGASLVVGTDLTTFADTSVLEVQLGANTNTQNAIIFTEDTGLGGTLEFDVSDALKSTLQYGDELQILEYGSRMDSGEDTFFDEFLGIEITTDMYLAPIYEADSLFMRATLVGDTNFDGTVSTGDLFALIGNLDRPGGWEEGDFTGDGMVTTGDLFLMIGHLDRSEADFPNLLSSAPLFADSGFATIPEPGSLVLVGLGSCLMLLRRGRHR